MHQNVIARKPRNEHVLPLEARAEMKFVTHALMNSLSPNLAAQAANLSCLGSIKERLVLSHWEPENMLVERVYC